MMACDNEKQKKAFIAYLKRTASKVAKWPKWKRTVLGPLMVGPFDVQKTAQREKPERPEE